MDDKPWLKHYDPQVPASLAPYPDLPVFHFLEESARKYPEHVCTIFKGATLTYRQVDELSDRLAAGLASLGVKKGQPVGIMLPNIPQFVVAYYAILKAGGVVVAMNPTYTPRELEKPLNDAGLEVVLAMSKFYGALNQARPNSKLKAVVVTNIKEALPPLLKVLFTLAKEKKDGRFHMYLNLEDAFEAWKKDQGPREWRTHIHVPVFLDDLGPFRTTRFAIEDALKFHKANPVSRQLEIETYTWDVLPSSLKTGDIVDYVCRELEWVQGQLL